MVINAMEGSWERGMEILNRLSRKAPPEVRENAMQIFGGELSRQRDQAVQRP